MVEVKEHLRRRPRKTIVDKFGHRISVGEWPSTEGLAKLRRHYKRHHPKAFREMIEKAKRTRRMKQLRIYPYK